MTEAYRIVFALVVASISFMISSLILRWILLYLKPDLQISKRIDWRDTGTWIGLCEFALILMFVFLNEYTAIAIIFAAKELARSEEVKRNPTYYLLGTLLNVTMAIISSFIIRSLAFRLFP